MTESPPSPSPLAPFILRNFILPLFIFTHKSLLNLTLKFKPLQILRYLIFNSFFFFIQLIFSDSNSEPDSDSGDYLWVPFLKGGEIGKDNYFNDSTCISRALSQLLAIVNEIPVSSRKYEIVRSYAEKLIDENLEEGYEPLRRVNVTVLAGAFSRALRQLEVAAAELPAPEEKGNNSGEDGWTGLDRVVKTVGRVGEAAWTRFRKRKMRVGGSAEKLAAELIWVGEKLAACGGAEEAVRLWASASKLASMSLSAKPRLQGSLVKLSVFLFKQAATMGTEDDEDDTVEELRKIKMNMLMSWLPFLVRSSIGTDAPVLTLNEKTEVENVLGELIGSLKHEEEQENVLSLWLHHFTHCPYSDWPNLHLYYARWCTTSRKLLVLQGK